MVKVLRGTHPRCSWNRTLSKKGRGVKMVELLAGHENRNVTAEAPRSQREIFLLLQSGGGDWSRNSVPSGLRSIPLMAVVPIMSLVLRNRNPFIWRYLSAKQKIVSPRSLRLRGENSILDRFVVTYSFIRAGSFGGFLSSLRFSVWASF